MNTTWTYEAVSNPDGIEVRDAGGEWVAMLTEGATTVRMTGPRRTFSEPCGRPIEHGVWVRTLPSPFSGDVDPEWLLFALEANNALTPDVLAIGLQYIAGAAPIVEGSTQIAGDASYGPPLGRTRVEGSDFYDYLGESWEDPEGTTHEPREDQFRCLDCSGLVRMMWGYRHSLPGVGLNDRVPLCWDPSNGALPRRAVQMSSDGPGVIVIPNDGERPADLSPLKVGDLVFFDASSNDGSAIDHVGIYMGRDADRHRRFLSSRKSADGPTLGDFRHASILDGSAVSDLYTRSFRTARRL